MVVRRPLADRELLTVQDVAFLLNVSPRTIWRWVVLGKIPAPIRYSRRLTRWRACDIEAYIRGLQPFPPL